MKDTTIRKGVLVTGGAVAAVLLAGCTGEAADSAAPGTTTRPVTSSVQERAQASTPSPAPTSPAPAADNGECKVADLKPSFGFADSTAGTTYRLIIFTNKGTRACTMQGFPGVSFVGGDDGHQVGPAAERSGDKLPAVKLKPGDSANVTLGFRDGLFTADNCAEAPTRGLRIYAPDEYDSMFLPSDGKACSGDLAQSQLTVTSVVPGTEPAK
jgi:Protein of unknown function (DUF4232)